MCQTGTLIKQIKPLLLQARVMQQVAPVPTIPTAPSLPPSLVVDALLVPLTRRNALLLQQLTAAAAVHWCQTGTLIKQIKPMLLQARVMQQVAPVPTIPTTPSLPPSLVVDALLVPLPRRNTLLL
jgi:hypothetical protein